MDLNTGPNFIELILKQVNIDLEERSRVIMMTSVPVQCTGIAQWLQIIHFVNFSLPLFGMLNSLVKLVQSNTNHPQVMVTNGIWAGKPILLQLVLVSRFFVVLATFGAGLRKSSPGLSNSPYTRQNIKIKDKGLFISQCAIHDDLPQDLSVESH